MNTKQRPPNTSPFQRSRTFCARIEQMLCQYIRYSDASRNSLAAPLTKINNQIKYDLVILCLVNNMSAKYVIWTVYCSHYGRIFIALPFPVLLFSYFIFYLFRARFSRFCCFRCCPFHFMRVHFFPSVHFVLVLNSK